MSRRSYGSGSLAIRVDRNGRESWYGLWMAGGRRVKRRIGLKRADGSGRDGLTRTQAEKELRRLMAETPTVVARETRKTVAVAGAAYVDHLEGVMERKRTTIQDYRGYLRRHLGPHFGGRTIDKIGPEHVEAYLHAKRAIGLSSKTVTNHLTFLHGLFTFAVKRRWVAVNPVGFVDRPRQARQGQRRIRFLQPVEVEALLRAVPDDDLGQLERPLYLCAVMTGLRQGELLALKWMDVDWLARRIRVADNFPRGRSDRADSPKSHFLRSVPMANRLGGELERHFQVSAYRDDEDLVFCHPHSGLAYDASRLRKRFDETTERAGVRRVTFHELRHTFGTQMAAAGAPLRAIQEWMGHADSSTTEIYAHYAPDATNGAAFAERAFGGSSVPGSRDKRGTRVPTTGPCAPLRGSDCCG
jgi:integrase